MMVYFYPERWTDADDSEGAGRLKANAQRRVAPYLQRMPQRPAVQRVFRAEELVEPRV